MAEVPPRLAMRRGDKAVVVEPQRDSKPCRHLESAGSHVPQRSTCTSIHGFSPSDGASF